MRLHPSKLESSSAFIAIACIALAILPATARAQASRLYMPVLSASDSLDTGLALSNPALEYATAILTVRNYAGALIQGPSVTNPKTLILPPQSQIALRASEIFGTGISPGWVEVQLSSPDVRGFFMLFDSGLTFIDGAVLAESPASRLIFPKVTSNPSAANRLTLINTGDQEISRVAISLFENSGRLIAQSYFRLPAYGGFSGAVTDLVGNLGVFDGYAVVEGIVLPRRDALIGFEVYRDRSDIAVLNAMKESARFRAGYLPHLASQGGYYSTLVLLNFDSESQPVRITAESLQVGGQPNSPSSVTVGRSIPPNGRLEERVDQMFGFSGNELITGYVRYETEGSGSGLNGYLEFRAADGSLLSAVPAQGTGYSDLWFSHVAQGAGYYTGLAFLNANQEPVLVTVDTLDFRGRRVASTLLSLAPGERLSRLLGELSPSTAGQLGGTVHLTASNAIFAFQLFGTDSLNVLANVPAQGSILQPQESGRSVSSRLGGYVLAADGSASVTIPPGALSDDTAVNIRSVSPSDLPKPSSDESIAAAVEVLWDGVGFRVPVRITFSLDSLLPPGSVLPVRTFQPSLDRYDQSEFVAIVSSSGRVASAEVGHSALFALAAPDSKPGPSGGIVQISTLTPASGATGTAVTISGSGFSPDPDKNTVMFEGPGSTNVVAPVLRATENVLETTLPAGATTGKVFVRVGSLTSNGHIFTISDEIRLPVVTTITPSGVLVGEPAVTIDIVGRGFTRMSVVYYDGTSITPTCSTIFTCQGRFVDSTKLQLTLSGTQLKSGIHRLAVSNISPLGMTSNPGAPPSTVREASSNQMDFVVENPVPSISGIIPRSSGVGVAQVTISGSGFIPSSKVQVAGSTVESAYINSDSIVAAIPLPVVDFRVLTVKNPVPGGGLSNSAPIQIENLPPNVNAGPDQVITLPAYVNLNGTASDDGLPTGNMITLTWSKVSGPGLVVFYNPNVATTTASFSAPGSYVLRLTASDGALSNSDDIGITVNPAIIINPEPSNQPPTVKAGPNQTITLPASALLNGTASDDGLPSGSTLTTTWSKLSGTGMVTFSNAKALSTTASFSAAGSYVLRLTASDGALSNSNDIVITVNPEPPSNQPPTVNAGPDQTITLPASAVLRGTASDDGLPTGSTLTTTWSKLSGTGMVTFSNAKALSTTASFSAAGSYVLRLTGSDGALSSSDDITIAVNPAVGANQPPVVNAGPGQTITLPASAVLNGTASDDGLPIGSTLTTTWSKLSGTGTVTFGDVNALTTTASFSAAGSYVLRLTASDGVFSTSDEITIVVTALGLTDSAVHSPPTSGPFAYDTFKPGQPGFPGLGQTYVDPVFGSVIRRITNEQFTPSYSDIYSKNGWWNANGTRFIHRTSNGLVLIDARSGTVVRTGIPAGSIAADGSLDPVDPDAWYFYSGEDLRTYNLTTGVTSVVKIFPDTLESLGGSVDWIDRTGRYFLINYADGIHLWDKQTDIIYAGSVPADFGGGWVGITPDGNYIVKAGPGKDHTSYAVNHATRTISTTGTMFWSLCGDHGDLVSASDGKNYFVTFECHNQAAIYRVDITLPQSASNVSKQQTDNVVLIDTDWLDSGHISCAAKRPNQDWCYISMESGDDTFSSMGTWRPYKQEIVMVQAVPPFTVRRLAHHRSRLDGGYYHTPRVSTSWDGLSAAWASNYGYNANPAQYADIYVIETAALAQSSPSAGASYLLANKRQVARRYFDYVAAFDQDRETVQRDLTTAAVPVRRRKTKTAEAMGRSPPESILSGISVRSTVNWLNL